MIRTALASTALILTACTGSPPPLDTEELPPAERVEDWEDWGPDENLRRRVTGEPLKGPELTSRLVGNRLEGCYANGDPFAEVLTEDGNVLDSRGATVARYAVQDDSLCFAYPNQNPACYTVTSHRDGLLFYTAGGFALVASTLCPIPSDVQGLPQ